MKKYMQPTVKVIELSVEDAFLGVSSLSTNNQVGDDMDYTHKKGGWGSELWAETEEK